MHTYTLYRHTYICTHHTHTHLRVEVEKPVGTVDIVERSKRYDLTINGHGMDMQGCPVTHQQPMGIGPTDEHPIESTHIPELPESRHKYVFILTICSI